MKETINFIPLEVQNSQNLYLSAFINADLVSKVKDSNTVLDMMNTSIRAINQFHLSRPDVFPDLESIARNFMEAQQEVSRIYSNLVSSNTSERNMARHEAIHFVKHRAKFISDMNLINTAPIYSSSEVGLDFPQEVVIYELATIPNEG